MKKFLMLFVILSMSAAYAGSDSEEEKSPSEKKAAKQYAEQREEENLPLSQGLPPLGPQEDIPTRRPRFTTHLDADAAIQDLFTKISKLDMSNKDLKNQIDKLERNNEALITTNKILSTIIQDLMKNKGLEGHNPAHQEPCITIQGLNIKIKELEVNNQILSTNKQDLNNQLNTDWKYAQQEHNQANQALGIKGIEAQVAELEKAGNKAQLEQQGKLNAHQEEEHKEDEVQLKNPKEKMLESKAEKEHNTFAQKKDALEELEIRIREMLKEPGSALFDDHKSARIYLEQREELKKAKAKKTGAKKKAIKAAYEEVKKAQDKIAKGYEKLKKAYEEYLEVEDEDEEQALRKTYEEYLEVGDEDEEQAREEEEMVGKTVEQWRKTVEEWRRVAEEYLRAAEEKKQCRLF